LEGRLVAFNDVLGGAERVCLEGGGECAFWKQLINFLGFVLELTRESEEIQGNPRLISGGFHETGWSQENPNVAARCQERRKTTSQKCKHL
jgi:hypothetical protein